MPLSPKEQHELLQEFGALTERAKNLQAADERIEDLIKARSEDAKRQHNENVERLDGIVEIVSQLPLYRREFLEHREDMLRRLPPLEAFMQGIQTERDRRRWLGSKAAWLWGLAGAIVTAIFAFYDRLKDLFHFGSPPPH
jgi:hypothetical protein